MGNLEKLKEMMNNDNLFDYEPDFCGGEYFSKNKKIRVPLYGAEIVDIYIDGESIYDNYTEVKDFADNTDYLVWISDDLFETIKRKVEED